MRVLLDNNVDRRFAPLIVGHDIVHVQNVGWSNLQNGELIAAAENEGYEVMVTADKRMKYQQNLTGRKISIVVLNSRFIVLKEIAQLAPQLLLALDNLADGSFIVINPE